jgi:hypothetical protein
MDQGWTWDDNAKDMLGVDCDQLHHGCELKLDRIDARSGLNKIK